MCYICGTAEVCFFFFKQKTAYEMRISDWSSDVCSSDLRAGEHPRRRRAEIADHRHQRRPQRMAAKDDGGRQPLGAGGADEILVENIGQPRPDRKSVV